MPSATPVEPVVLPAPAAFKAGEGGDLMERAKTFRILPQKRACAPSSADVIVVCAPEDGERYRYQPAGPPPPTTMEEFGDALRLKIGPVEADVVQMPTLHGAPSIGVRTRIRF